jgi:hypothetical protein
MWVRGLFLQFFYAECTGEFQLFTSGRACEPGITNPVLA